MSKAELSTRIATETSLSKAGADGAVAAVFSTIDDAVASGDTDRIASFGTFLMRSRPARATAGCPAQGREHRHRRLEGAFPQGPQVPPRSRQLAASVKANTVAEPCRCVRG